eukprot:m.2681 g.2681  ORF g.2681 m.2681 type:complete len:57 (+) comp3821_c0_seq1:361-531(+)
MPLKVPFEGAATYLTRISLQTHLNLPFDRVQTGTDMLSLLRYHSMIDRSQGEPTPQ